MNSAHAALLQWLQENQNHAMVLQREESYWKIMVKDMAVGKPAEFGFGPSYEAACYDLLQRLKR